MAKLQLYRVPLNAGGYERNGAYWGRGGPLYCVPGEGYGESDRYFRARDREHAKATYRAQYDAPDAKFYR